MTARPALFVTHGAPTLIEDRCPAREFLARLGAELERPEAIVCVSAHWERPAPTVSSAEAPATIHDFHGFPPALYAHRYAAPGAPRLAARVAALLREAGLDGEVEPERGLDHGAWVPLKLIWPAADIPVLQLSVQPTLGPAHHVALGRALAPLRAENVLVLASGSATHDLSEWHRYGLSDPPAPYAAAFADWLDDAVARGDGAALAGYLEAAPEARRNHPSPEHYLPLLAAFGAGGAGAGRKLHGSYTFGVFYMGAYAFG